MHTNDLDATQIDPFGQLVTSGQSLRIGQYELDRELGRGGMGVVWRAHHVNLKKFVAIKTLQPTSHGDSQARQRFYREMEAIGQLDHPNIVRALDAGEMDGIHYLVMEYVNGYNLEQICRQHGQLPIAESCDCIRQAALGLAHAHDRGIVHRDVKPSNILIGADGSIKISDLGLARGQSLAPLTADLTKTGDLVGTVDYCSPEQIEHGQDVDARSDLYSLGCTWYRLLCGRPPFSRPEFSTVWKKLDAHRQVVPTSAKTLRADLPPALLALLNRLLAKEPKDRIATALQLAQELEPHAASADWRMFCKSPRAEGPANLGYSTASLCDPHRQTVRLRRKLPSLTAPVAALRQIRPQRIIVGGVVFVCLILVLFVTADRTSLTRLGTPDDGSSFSANSPPAELPSTGSFAAAWLADLGSTPTEVIWPGRRGRRSVLLNEANRVLEISSDSPCLVQIGTATLQQPWQLTLKMEHISSVDRGGIYWGYREQDDGSGPYAVMQLVRVRRYSIEGVVHTALHRMKAKLDPESNGLEVLYETSAPMPPFPRLVELQLGFRGEDLLSLRWGDREYPEFCSDAVNSACAVSPSEVNWGGFVEQGEIWASKPTVITAQ